MVFNLGATATMKAIPMPAKWLEGAELTVYCTDIYGNWNKNDTSPPHVASVLRDPIEVFRENSTTIYALASDWSPITKVQLIYSNGTSWNTVNMTYDESMHLYYATIPPQPEGTVVMYKFYAEDIYGNSGFSDVYSYTVVSGRKGLTVEMIFAIGFLIVIVALLSALLYRRRR